MTTLALPAILLTWVVGALGAIDGVYFHLWRFRLHARRESAREHLTHSLRAALAGPIIWLLFASMGAGVWLWLAAALIAVDFGVLLWDLVEEKGSRASLGGIPPIEYGLHVVAASLHAAASALALGARPASAWLWGAAPVEQSAAVVGLAHALWPGALALAALHFALMLPCCARWLPAPNAAS